MLSSSNSGACQNRNNRKNTGNTWSNGKSRHVGDFKIDLQRGQVGENAFLRRCIDLGAKRIQKATMQQQSNGIDFIMPFDSISIAVDVKTDYRAAATGNYYVERSVGTNKGWGTKQGTDYFIWAIMDPAGTRIKEWTIIDADWVRDCVINPRPRFKKGLTHDKRAKENAEVRGYLIPLNDEETIAHTIYRGPAITLDAIRAMHKDFYEKNNAK